MAKQLGLCLILYFSNTISNNVLDDEADLAITATRTLTLPELKMHIMGAIRVINESHSNISESEQERYENKIDILNKEIQSRERHIARHNCRAEPIPLDNLKLDDWTFHFIRSNQSPYEHDNETQPILRMYITEFTRSYIPTSIAVKLTRGNAEEFIRNP